MASSMAPQNRVLHAGLFAATCVSTFWVFYVLFDGGVAPDNAVQNITGTYPNGSVPTTFDLTPTQDYSCSTASGSISWVASTKTLSVSGVMYIDGSAAVTKAARPGCRVRRASAE